MHACPLPPIVLVPGHLHPSISLCLPPSVRPSLLPLSLLSPLPATLRLPSVCQLFSSRFGTWPTPAILLIYSGSWTLMNGTLHCIVPAWGQRVLAFDIVHCTCLSLALIHELIGSSLAGRGVNGTVLHALVIWWKCVYQHTSIHPYLFVSSNLLLMTASASGRLVCAEGRGKGDCGIKDGGGDGRRRGGDGGRKGERERRVQQKLGCRKRWDCTVFSWKMERQTVIFLIGIEKWLEGRWEGGRSDCRWRMLS